MLSRRTIANHPMNVPLHPPPLGCSEFVDDTNNDGVIACRPDKTSDDEDPTLGLLSGLASEATDQNSAQSVPGIMPRVRQSESIENAKPPPPAKKRGRKKGSVTTLDITRGQWYHACKKYRELDNGSVKMSHSEFLRSDQTEQMFNSTISQRQAFGRWLKKYDDGSLQDSSAKREKRGKFTEIEDQLLSYLDSQAQAHRSDNCGITWVVMQEMCIKWAEERNIADFKGSTGWLNATLNKRQQTKKGDAVTEAMTVIKSHILSNNFSHECLTALSSLEESMQLERLKQEPNKKKRRQKQPPCKKQPSLSSHIGKIHDETI